MERVFLTLIIICLTTGLYSQTTLKFGHVNYQNLIQAMPESDTAQLKLENATKELQNQYQVMQVEYNKKKQDLDEKRESYSDLIKKTKDAELSQIEQCLQQFQQLAEQDLQNQRISIFKPVLDRANKAIADVAKENGFTYIFDIAQGSVLFHSETSIDVLPLVKQKLGLLNRTTKLDTNPTTK